MLRRDVRTLRNIYRVEKFQFIHNELHFSLNENDKKIKFQPAHQVLADSDGQAFIYLVEEGDNLSYVSFPKNVWPQLLEIVKREKNPHLQIGGKSIELENFYEELLALIYNIEGNDNYGEDFVKAVEETFHEILVEETE